MAVIPSSCEGSASVVPTKARGAAWRDLASTTSHKSSRVGPSTAPRYARLRSGRRLQGLARQIEPLGIRRIDERDLLFASPSLQLLLSFDRLGCCLERFNVDQPSDVVLCRVNRHTTPMFFQATPKIRSDSNVQCPAVRTCENVDDSSSGHGSTLKRPYCNQARSLHSGLRPSVEATATAAPKLPTRMAGRPMPRRSCAPRGAP